MFPLDLPSSLASSFIFFTVPQSMPLYNLFLNFRNFGCFHFRFNSLNFSLFFYLFFLSLLLSSLSSVLSFPFSIFLSHSLFFLSSSILPLFSLFLSLFPFSFSPSFLFLFPPLLDPFLRLRRLSRGYGEGQIMLLISPLQIVMSVHSV